MARKRIIYNTLGIASNYGTIAGVQSFNYDFTLPYENVTEYGNLGVKDTIINGQPDINFTLNYILNNVDNESKIGFGTSTATMDNILNDNFILNFTGFIGKEGVDLTDSNIEGAMIFKSGYLTNYSLRGAVGELVTADVGFTFNDLVFQQTTSPVYTNLIPTGFSQNQTCESNDLGLNINSIGLLTGDFKIQNFTLNLNINRSPEIYYGKEFAEYRYINYPINIDLESEVIIGDLQNDTLSQIVNNQRKLNLILKTPLKTYSIGNCKLVSENFNSSIGPNTTVNLRFQSVLGGANDNLNYFRIN
jgi:hypothetical protein